MKDASHYLEDRVYQKLDPQRKKSVLDELQAIIGADELRPVNGDRPN